MKKILLSLLFITPIAFADEYPTCNPEADDAAIHQLGIYRGAAKTSGDANHVVYYDQMKIAKSCKKINLKKLGYSCKDLESQKLKKMFLLQVE